MAWVIPAIYGGKLIYDELTKSKSNDAVAAAGQSKLQNIGAATQAVQDQRARMAQVQLQQLKDRMGNYQGANNVLASMYGGGGMGGRPATIPTQGLQQSMGSISQGPAFNRLQQLIPQSIPVQQNQQSMGSIGQGPSPSLGNLMPAQIPVPQNQQAMGGISRPNIGALQRNLLTPDMMDAAAQRTAMGSIMGGPGQAAPPPPGARGLGGGMLPGASPGQPPPSELAQSGILRGFGGGIRGFG